MTSLNIPKTTCTELDGLEELGLKGRLSPFANQKKFLSSNPSKNCSATHCLENFLITSHTGINLRPWPHPRPSSQEKGTEVSENKSRLVLDGEDSSPCKPTILKKPSLLDGFFLRERSTLLPCLDEVIGDCAPRSTQRALRLNPNQELPSREKLQLECMKKPIPLRKSLTWSKQTCSRMNSIVLGSLRQS